MLLFSNIKKYLLEYNIYFDNIIHHTNNIYIVHHNIITERSLNLPNYVLNLPSVVQYYENGQQKTQFWYKNGIEKVIFLLKFGITKMANLRDKFGIKMVKHIEKKIYLLLFTITKMDNLRHNIGIKMVNCIEKVICLILLIITKMGNL